MPFCYPSHPTPLTHTPSNCGTFICETFQMRNLPMAEHFNCKTFQVKNLSIADPGGVGGVGGWGCGGTGNNSNCFFLLCLNSTDTHSHNHTHTHTRPFSSEALLHDARLPLDRFRGDGPVLQEGVRHAFGRSASTVCVFIFPLSKLSPVLI